MATTTNTHTATAGQQDFAVTFEYIEQNDVFVTVNGTAQANPAQWTFFNPTTIRFGSGLTAGDVVLIYRRTDEDLLEARFLPGSAIRAKDLNANDEQLLFLIQENQTAIKAIQGDNDSGELPPPDPGDTVVLDDLGDVNITSPANGNILEYDGSEWVNTTWHQADWNETTTTDPSFIQNKPNIQDAQIFLGTRNCVANGPTGSETANDVWENTTVGNLDSGWGLGSSVASGPGCKLVRNSTDTAWQHLTVGVSSIIAGDNITVNTNAVNPTISVNNTNNRYIQADGSVDFTGNQGSTATGSFQIASGTTLERNGTPADGMIRYNTDLNTYEGYSDGNWGSLGGGLMHVGTTAPTVFREGNQWYDTETGRAYVYIDGSTDAWVDQNPGGGGGTTKGGGQNLVFQENEMVCTADYQLTANRSALSAGPITINDGVTITIPNNQNWVIL